MQLSYFPVPRASQLRAAWLMLFSLGFVALPARAENDDGVLMGMEAAQSGGAVTATIGGGASAFYNPAGLASGAASSIDASANAYGMRLYRIDGMLRGPEGESTDGRVVDWIIAPALLSYVRRMSRVSLSFAIFIPATNDLSTTDELRTRGGTRWLFSIELRDTRYYTGFGLGARVSSRLRVGVSVLGVYDSQSTRVMLAGGGPERRALSLFSRDDAKTYGVNARFGVQWEPHRSLSLGLNVIAPDLVLMQRNQTANATILPEDGGSGSSFLPQQVDETRTRPVLGGAPGVRVGAAYRYPRGWASLDGTLNLPLRAREAEDDRKLGFNLRLGMTHELSPAWGLGAGAFTDLNPLRARGTDFYGGTLGLKYSHDYTLRAGGAVSFVTGLSGRYAYGTGPSFALDLPTLLPGVQPRLTNAIGRQRTHELSATIGTSVVF